MIVTVTPNPSVDRTVFVDALHPGKIMRSTRSWSEPSGKGVNVALALRAHGRPTLAVLPVGGPAGAQLVEMLNGAGLSYQRCPSPARCGSTSASSSPTASSPRSTNWGPP